MAGTLHVLLVTVAAAVSVNNVFGCLRYAGQDDIDRLTKDVTVLQRQVFEQSEALKQNKREVKPASMEPTDLTQLKDKVQTLRQSVDALLNRQSQFEKIAEKAEAHYSDIKNSIERLEQEINHKADVTEQLIKEMQTEASQLLEDYKQSSQKIDILNHTFANHQKQLQQSLYDTEVRAQENYKSVKEELDELTAIVNSDLKSKVDEFDKHIESIQSAKTKADEILSDVKEGVDKILPNTFNKGAFVSAFLILVVLVFGLAYCVYALHESVNQNIKRQ